MRKVYSHVGLGGTFDHFHAGHEHFLRFAAGFGRRLHLGLTHPKLALHKPYAELIEDYEVRFEQVKNFCQKNKIQASITQLADVYGPTLDEKSKIQALVVTEETAAGADKINQARQAAGLPELPVQVCPMLRDESGEIISSERIRSGKINRQGIIYQSVLREKVILDQTQRDFFSQLHGELVEQATTSAPELVCVVGDYSLEKFITHDWPYDLGIYDKKQQRQVVKSAIINALQIDLISSNPAGQITPQLAQNLEKALQKKLRHIFIKGEEDLTAVALVLLLPLGSQIYYGHPDGGLAKITVDEAIKDQFFQVLAAAK